MAQPLLLILKNKCSILVINNLKGYWIKMSKDNNEDSNKNLNNITTKQELYKDIILEEDWLLLIDKHELRYEIWAILKLYNELNVTEISHLVKQSKSTVSRVLLGMEKDDHTEKTQ